MAIMSMSILRCGHCEVLFPPSTAQCSVCGSTRLYVVSCCGLGRVITWRYLTLASKRVGGADAATIAIVELDEGPWVYTLIEGIVPRMRRGPVRVSFRCKEPGERFPIFGLCA